MTRGIGDDKNNVMTTMKTKTTTTKAAATTTTKATTTRATPCAVNTHTPYLVCFAKVDPAGVFRKRRHHRPRTLQRHDGAPLHILHHHQQLVAVWVVNDLKEPH